MNYVSNFLSENETTIWMAYFQSGEISWTQETFSIYGRQVKVPRKSAFFGDDGLNYLYILVHLELKSHLNMSNQDKYQLLG